MGMMTTEAPSNLLFLCFSLLACLSPCRTVRGAEVRGMFVFGSSLVDNGNNNFLQNSLAKADYPPYGVDFSLGASGRFTNGKNIVDLLGDQLKLPFFLPPFHDPSSRGNKIIHGVNYASGASGILDDTGSIAGNVTSLSQQIRNFERQTLPELEEQLGCTSTESLPKYLFVVASGGNDYSFNYFLTRSTNNVSLEAFTVNLTTALSIQLKKLHRLGARKFVILSMNPNGCSPMAVALQPTRRGCLEFQNLAAQLFNSHLMSLVDVIKPQMPGSHLVFVNSYKIIRDIISNPAPNGFSDTSNACCQVLSANEGGTGVLCRRNGTACANRSIHVFFDGLHPTEAVNVLLAEKAYASNLKTEAYPFNVKQLALL